MRWFQEWGFAPTDPKANKTDFLLDVTSGHMASTDGHFNSRDVDWNAKWEEHGAAFLGSIAQQEASSGGFESNVPNRRNSQGRTHSQSQIAVAVDDSNKDNVGDSSLQEEEGRVPSRKSKRSFFLQTALFFYRAFLQRIKGSETAAYLIVHLIGQYGS
jgi:hypothetical protein